MGRLRFTRIGSWLLVYASSPLIRKTEPKVVGDGIWDQSCLRSAEKREGKCYLLKNPSGGREFLLPTFSSEGKKVKIKIRTKIEKKGETLGENVRHRSWEIGGGEEVMAQESPSRPYKPSGLLDFLVLLFIYLKYIFVFFFFFDFFRVLWRSLRLCPMAQ